jgi:hypothetical protein
MPTVLRKRGFEFYFFANEGFEPPHVHADKGNGSVKMWLQPLTVAESMGLKPAEVRSAMELAEEHRELLLEKWHEFFSHTNT